MRPAYPQLMTSILAYNSCDRLHVLSHLSMRFCKPPDCDDLVRHSQATDFESLFERLALRFRKKSRCSGSNWNSTATLIMQRFSILSVLGQSYSCAVGGSASARDSSKTSFISTYFTARHPFAVQIAFLDQAGDAHPYLVARCARAGLC